MTPRLKLAKLIFGYDPNTSPHKALASVRSQLQSAFRQVDELHTRMKIIAPEEVYECQGAYFFRRRPIQNRTRRYIVLEPDYEGDTRKHLPRQQIEGGEIVNPHEGDYYALGSTLRDHLNEEVGHIKSEIVGLVLSEMEIKDAIARNDEVILTPEDWRTFDRCWEDYGEPTPETPPALVKVDWKSEGF